MNATETLIRNYWTAVNNRDWPTFEDLVAEDILYILPQSREKIHGRAAFKEFNKTYPGNWSLLVTTLVPGEDQAASIITFIDHEQEQTGISFFKIAGGQIQSITEYWPTPYDPPPRNSSSVENY